jgi:OOP family OmpA-OmpF porin
MTLLATAGLLAGCGGFEAQRVYDEATGVTPQGDAYHQALYAGYMEHATYEQEKMMDYPDAIYHSRKAIMASRGETPTPTEPGERKLPADRIDEVTQGRARLVSALGAGGVQRDPEAAAKAQSFYDCWLEQLEENFQPRDIAYCRDGFYKNLEAIEPKAAPQMPEVIALSADVLFDFDKYNIKPQFRSELDKIAELLVKDTSANILVWGHTDTAGPKPYNQRLSERRADAVAAYLESKGVERSRMTVRGFGETQLAVQTPDNTPNAQNRRVEIRRR